MQKSLVATIGADKLPNSAACVLAALEEAGYEAWLVGGWVRDALLGARPHDVDICTNALWQESKAALEAKDITVHETGTAHGTITAVVSGEPIEVTTYRVEGTYSDNRHPDSVKFVRDIHEDLARRDFTINAMAWHPSRGLLDDFGGQEDLNNGVIRCVGKPKTRFSEDALRILRAIRFACRLGYSIEPATQAAIDACYQQLDSIAKERIGAELAGIVNSGHLAWALRHEQKVMCLAIPALSPLIGFNQESKYHCFDIYEHTVRVVEGIEAYSGGCTSRHLRWAAMLHDIGKPATFFTDEKGQGHFYGHPHEGAVLTKKYLEGLAIPKEEIRTIVALVRLHDRPMDANVVSELSLLRDLDEKAGTKSRQETLSLMHEMLDLRRADALAKAPQCRSYATELDKHEALLNTIEKAKSVCWRMDDLAITGKDLIANGIKPGPEIGELLKKALEGVLNVAVQNEKEALLKYLGL